MTIAQPMNIPIQGALLSQHRWSKSTHRRQLKVWIPFIILTAPFMVFFLFLPVSPFIFFAIRAWRRLRQTAPIVSLHQNGLVDARKGTLQFTAFSEIETLWMSIVSYGWHTDTIYKLRTHSGQEIKLTSEIGNIEALGHSLKEKLLDTQLPRATQTLKQGAAIHFGRLQLDAQGLMLGRKMLPWSEVESIEIVTSRVGKSRYVQLEIRANHEKYPWASFARNSFPNLPLFLTLAGSFQQQS